MIHRQGFSLASHGRLSARPRIEDLSRVEDPSRFDNRSQLTGLSQPLASPKIEAAAHLGLPTAQGQPPAELGAQACEAPGFEILPGWPCQILLLSYGWIAAWLRPFQARANGSQARQLIAAGQRWIGCDLGPARGWLGAAARASIRRCPKGGLRRFDRDRWGRLQRPFRGQRLGQRAELGELGDHGRDGRIHLRKSPLLDLNRIDCNRSHRNPIGLNRIRLSPRGSQGWRSSHHPIGQGSIEPGAGLGTGEGRQRGGLEQLQRPHTAAVHPALHQLQGSLSLAPFHRRQQQCCGIGAQSAARLLAGGVSSGRLAERRQRHGEALR